MNDMELLAAISQGNVDAFTDLLKRYEKRVFSYFYHCFHNESTDEDLTQNVFLALLQQLPRQWHQWRYFSRYLFNFYMQLAYKSQIQI